MSIKKSGTSSPSTRTSRTQRTRKTSSNRENGRDKKARSNSPADKKKDEFSASQELKDSRESKDSRKSRDAQKSDQAKDAEKAKKPEESKEEEKGSLLDKLADLQKQLDEMKSQKEEKPPENLGGCCGSKRSKQADDPQEKQDPDSELTQLAIAVLRGGQPAPTDLKKPQSKPGEKQVGSIPQGSPAQLKATLSQKYQTYKSQGVQLRKETEQLVESALNGNSVTAPAGQPTTATPTQSKEKASSTTKPAAPKAKAA